METRKRATYYFLGLTLREHINQGLFYPSYILCKSLTTSNSRTGYRVSRVFDGKPSKNLPKVLVSEPYGHDDLLDFLSVYQAQEGYKGVHFHPEGALCWYQCNQYGDPTGVVVYARQVPIKYLMFRFHSKKAFREEKMKHVKTLGEILVNDNNVELLKNSCVKPRLYQRPGRKERKNAKSRSQTRNNRK